MTAIEGRTLLKGGVLLLVLSLLRLGVDSMFASDPILVEGSTDLSGLLEESLDAKEEEERRTAPFAPGETLDPNRSSEEELDRLPGIGPSTARAWATARREEGGFGKAEDLLNVPGIGPATLDKIRPFLDFSGGVPLDILDRRRDRTTGPTQSERTNPRVTPPDPPSSGRRPRRIDLNRASPQELESLPGIGPALAARIVENRRRYGLFVKPEDLLRVRGIGPATLEGIRELVLPQGL
jgi:competence protein ComEA